MPQGRIPSEETKRLCIDIPELLKRFDGLSSNQIVKHIYPVIHKEESAANGRVQSVLRKLVAENKIEKAVVNEKKVYRVKTDVQTA